MRFEDEIKTKQPIKNEKGKAVINTIYTGNLLTEMVVQDLKKYDINDQHFNVLRILKGRYPEAISPGDIKEVLLNKRGDLTRLLDKLDKKGWVKRTTNVENRRMVDVVLTAKGVKALDRINKDFVGAQALSDNITIAEAKELNRILDKLRG